MGEFAQPPVTSDLKVPLPCAKFWQLGYDFLGNWIDREDNRNIEESLLHDWLAKRGVSKVLIKRALGLDDAYWHRLAGLLRLPVQVKPVPGA